MHLRGGASHVACRDACAEGVPSLRHVATTIPARAIHPFSGVMHRGMHEHPASCTERSAWAGLARCTHRRHVVAPAVDLVRVLPRLHQRLELLFLHLLLLLRQLPARSKREPPNIAAIRMRAGNPLRHGVKGWVRMGPTLSRPALPCDPVLPRPALRPCPALKAGSSTCLPEWTPPPLHSSSTHTAAYLPPSTLRAWMCTCPPRAHRASCAFAATSACTLALLALSPASASRRTLLDAACASRARDVASYGRKKQKQIKGQPASRITHQASMRVWHGTHSVARAFAAGQNRQTGRVRT